MTDKETTMDSSAEEALRARHIEDILALLQRLFPGAIVTDRADESSDSQDFRVYSLVRGPIRLRVTRAALVEIPAEMLLGQVQLTAQSLAVEVGNRASILRALGGMPVVTRDTAEW